MNKTELMQHADKFCESKMLDEDAFVGVLHGFQLAITECVKIVNNRIDKLKKLKRPLTIDEVGLELIDAMCEMEFLGEEKDEEAN